jgi:folate-binding protein YgfZ
LSAEKGKHNHPVFCTILLYYTPHDNTDFIHYIVIMRYTFLPERGVLRLSGEDTPAFLQGLVSNDVSRLAETGILYAALLSPQGKYLHDFFLAAWEKSVLIDCEKERLPDLHKRLAMYRLRSKVTMEVMPGDFGVAALWDGKIQEIAAGKIRVRRDPRLAALGWRAVGDKDAIAAWCQEQEIEPVDADAYDRMRIEAGVPESRDMVVDKSLLLQFGFEELHGVDFHKGCYVGQEVTARSKHIGQVRKFLYKIRCLSGVLPPMGSPIYLGDEAAGELRSHAGGKGLALMKVEMVEKASRSGMDFRCGDAVLKAELPAWAIAI